MSIFREWERLAKENKAKYPPGTRIQLIKMNDPHSPVEEGTRGTVKHVDDSGQLHMQWDNGRTLALVPGEDSFRKLTDRELSEEQSLAKDKGKDSPAKDDGGTPTKPRKKDKDFER